MKRSPKSQVPSPKSQARYTLRPLRRFSPSTRSSADSSLQRGYLLTEALVYIGVVFVILGIGYLAMYQCIDNCIVLRRNADDIVGTLAAGEQWRADVRAANPRARLEGAGENQVLHLEGARGSVDYRFADGIVFRRSGSGDWGRVIDRVKSCSFQSELRQNLSVWRWELELEPRLKGAMKPGRVRPLFTFLAVSQSAVTR